MDWIFFCVSSSWMLWLLLDCYCCRFYGRLVYVASSEAARWRYARLYMRQNGYHMCISRFVHCLSIVSVSLWCYWNVIGAVLCFVRQQMLWPTNTISLIYCNGFKLCERQTALFYCTHTHTHTVIFLIALPSFSITKIHLPIKINRNLFLISLMRTA